MISPNIPYSGGLTPSHARLCRFCGTLPSEFLVGGDAAAKQRERRKKPIRLAMLQIIAVGTLWGQSALCAGTHTFEARMWTARSSFQSATFGGPTALPYRYAVRDDGSDH